MQIVSRFDGHTLYECEADTILEALQAAVKARANLYGANLYGANLYEANLYEANLYEANLYGATLYGANLYGANLSEADLCGANLSRANLSEADLYGANLYEANLPEANLSRADLYGANLYEANLSRANLSEADLYGANLSRANLSEADLSRANLYEANLYGATGVNADAADDLRLLREQPGAVRAYKLVTAEGTGPTYPRITYEIGRAYEEQDCNSDETVQCGRGINLATLPWCVRKWRPGYKILVAEFTAADIVAIPYGTDGKFRVRRCTIVAEKDLSGLVDHVESRREGQ